MKKSFTVFGVYQDDNDQRFATMVEAETPEEAEALALREADGDLIVAGVVAGSHQAVDRAPIPSITKIRGRGYHTRVARVHVTYHKLKLPFTCPKCKADLRKQDSLHQEDLSRRPWHGRIPRGEYEGGHGVPLNHDRGAGLLIPDVGAIAYHLSCTKCQFLLWNGLSMEGAEAVDV